MRFALALAILHLLSVSPAIALCELPQPRLVCAEYFASKVVVEATLMKVRSTQDKDDPDGVVAYEYSLHANRVIRGHIDSVFMLHEGNDSGRATFEWHAGRKYLLFLFYSDSDKAWKLDGCGNSTPVSDAKAVLQQIAAIQASHGGGVIHGVISQEAMSASISKVLVEARGAKGVFTANANSKGEFEIKVPAGEYAVRAISTGFSFKTADFSYENPNEVRIESGGCAQIQLVANVSETSNSLK